METAVTLGARIAALRKAKAMTQEQLAAAVGVSAPAVSKWETDSSCPDIALLCPLARALGTNVDTLLHFERDLPDEEAVRQTNAILEIALRGDPDGAERALQELLHTYPACTAVQFYGAVLYGSLGFMLPQSARESERGERWRQRCRALMQAVLDAGPGPYWQSTAVQLAGQLIQDGDLDQAEALLDRLPKREASPESLRAMLYLKQGNVEKARAAVQGQLYLRVNEVLTGLMQLTGRELTPDPQQAMNFCRLYARVSELFDLPDYSAAALLLGVCLRTGNRSGAKEQLLRCLTELAKPPRAPQSPCFAPAVHDSGSAETSARQLRQMFLLALEQDEEVQPLLQDTEIAPALKALRAAAESPAAESPAP